MHKLQTISTFEITISKNFLAKVQDFLKEHMDIGVITILTLVALFSFMFYYTNGLGLKYNDARSHLDIGRRVVEGLKPGIAQLGSVWLPLPHVLMIPTIWSDFFWHTGLSGALVSMLSFVATGYLVYLFLKRYNVGILGQIVGVGVMASNINTLYLTSTAMTELLLLATMTAGVYYLIVWAKDEKIINLVKSAFWIMLATITRYDGWFLFAIAALLIGAIVLKKRKIHAIEGNLILFATLAGFGIFLWFLWNLLIFNDPLYFIFGPYSAHAQQAQLKAAGELPTIGNFYLSLKTYLFAMMYNSYTYPAIVGLIGLVVLWFDRKIDYCVRIASIALFAPFVFNILALYLGHSVLFLPEIIGNTWFNVRYGLMMVPTLAIAFGYIVDRSKNYRWVLLGLFFLISFFSFISYDAVTIDDALYGASQKNVSEVSGWLRENTKSKEGYILISAASHDAVIFSSGLPMKKFIHEGTGAYWDYAVEDPDKWASWIVLRTHDVNDLTFREIQDAQGFKNFELVDHYPFADIYQLKPEYRVSVITKPILGKLK
ncbi:MAG: Glycosyl transferase family 2 [Microgenomates group bacterium GW2011_GWC1_37_8]|uniref:Glycosyl transferase family 2 n=1 Tax=Candidatus Woesebacteria bacterium GW2011_GWB1_38_8 TaxID=1618570 RepID=A0A0G0PAC6_9BACT|nr:MAG: Glycosyl transferase family 2 [Microgenomates group bacterium GW2011_GWC1_37_8]KKQ86251.1 MAG: Glycosyl transferase family 2 [Candidatus Woesebacteria bacterium GW2011_GWB1_38_8]